MNKPKVLEMENKIMTREEEIRQKAVRYLPDLHAYGNYSTGLYVREAFKDGAEWSDAHNSEIAYLEHEIERLKSKLQAADDFNTLLTAELGKAKSPWISVDERLPKYCTIPSTEQYIKNKRYWDNKVAPIYLVICSDPQGDYYQLANFLKFPEDKKPSWVFTGDNIKRNCITHWMPIPELKET